MSDDAVAVMSRINALLSSIPESSQNPDYKKSSAVYRIIWLSIVTIKS